MFIKSKLTETNYINASFAMMYKKPIVKVVLLVLSLLFIAGTILPLFVRGKLTTQPLPALFILLFYFIVIYISAKKSYRSNKRFSETIEYELDQDGVVITGESFNTRYTWEKVYKVSNTKNWILLWQSRQIATPILKKDIQEGDISELKRILQVHRVNNDL